MFKQLVVKEMPENLRPRERLLKFGAKSLSDQELLAIILRTGLKGKNVLEVAQQLLVEMGDLSMLKNASIEELKRVNGIGQAKAIELLATIEFGARVSQAHFPRYTKVDSTTIAGELLVRQMQHYQQEKLYALFLNTKNYVIQQKVIFIGTVNSSVAHPREIFREAVKYPTARIIVAHNHPSGDPNPSPADLIFTKRLISCGSMMGIEILDHIIVGGNDYISLQDTTDLFFS